MASSSKSIIQSSSSSSSSSVVTAKNHCYDVFVSFRGKDTRHNFTDHLFAALQRKGIFAFRDDTKIKKGESIAPELLLAIQSSHVFVVVFSKNYASSTWCLRELEYILECVRVSGKRLLPVFYDVEPSVVGKQSGSYAEAFGELEERFKQDLGMVHRWREALTQVAKISGWEIGDKPQSAEIEKIVEEIMNILGHKVSSLPKDLVGLHSPLEALEKHLLLDSADNVRVVGICGMGGIGKTTLATLLYGRYSHQFGTCCFIDDLSKIYRDDGPFGAQKQILHQTLGKEHLQICNLYHATNMIQSRLRRVRALIVIDNVDQVEQLEKLAVNREWLGTGSRIIIISRDEHILKDYGVDVVYKVPILDDTNSLQLLCRKAFKLDHIISNFEELAYDVLNYANGLPLAIKVLGSFLFGRDVSEWRSALVRLRESPNKDIMDVLRLSFDGLEEMEKEIFLDIACFFNGRDEKYVKNVLQCRGLHPDIGLKVLIEKSLISILDKGWIQMHGLLQELGRKVILETSTKEPRKWSRLWLPEYLVNVISENLENNVEAIVLGHGSEVLGKECLIAKALSKMSHLRLLIFEGVNCSGSLNCLSNELRYVECDKYPFMYLPSSFQPTALSQLILEGSNIKQLWEGKKYLPNLRTLNLSNSKNLIKMPDFGEVPNLKELNLEGCVKLAKLDSSIGLLQKLVLLNLKYCKNLRSISINIFGLSSLKDLNLFGCSKVFLNASGSALHSQSTSSIFKRITLPFRSLYPTPKAHKDSGSASSLSSSLGSSSYLRTLDIGFCSLSQVPDAIGQLHWLEKLNLGGNNFVTLPSLKELSKLEYLNLEHCKHLKSLPELPSPPIVIEVQDWEKRGLYIFNCPELGEGSISTAFSWVIHFIRANNESHTPFDRIGMVIPGSEMPSWFNNQSEGDSISMDPSPIIDDNDNNIIGVAFCAVFSVSPYHPTMATNCRTYNPKLCFQFHSNHEVRYFWIPVNVDISLFKVKSNHMWLIYFNRESFFNIVSRIKTATDLLTRGPFKIVMEDDIKRGPHVEAKNIGYHWVDKHDPQQVNLTMMHNNGDSLARKRKFLAIEDEAQPQHNHSPD